MSKGSRNRQVRRQDEQPQLIAFQQQQIRQTITTGPLPTPEILEGYEKISTGFATRIFEMAEREQAHRHQIDQRVFKAHFSTIRIGQIFAFIIGMSAVCGGIYLLMHDKALTGLAVFITALAALVAAFLVSQKSNTTTVTIQKDENS